MERTFLVQNIQCDHCARTIRRELADIAGVQDVQVEGKSLTVRWEAPATWEQIRTTLGEIGYPPSE